MKFKIENVKISYPHLFRKAVINGQQTDAYSADFILDKDAHADLIKKLKSAIDKMTKEELKLKALPDNNNPLKTRDDGEIFLRAKNKKTAPICLNRDKTRVTEDDNPFYGGCVVNAIVHLRAYDFNSFKGVNAVLSGVQFVKDGQPFGDMPMCTEDDFDLFADEANEFAELDDDLGF